jgi:hypothetical protein
VIILTTLLTLTRLKFFNNFTHPFPRL